MKHKTIVLAAGLLIAAAASAADVKVIANPGIAVTAISTDELKGIYLGTKSALSDGSRAEPVLLKSGPAHGAFLREYLGKTEAALETYYRSLVFTGKGSMPKSLASDAEVAAYVARTKGAVGYVSPAFAAAGVKTLEIK
jgi:ABC-type phosphate transport system substrate-binding protein